MLTTNTPGNLSTNIIESYKPKEGTEAERQHISLAVRQVVKADRNDILDLYKVGAKQTGDLTMKVCVNLYFQPKYFSVHSSTLTMRVLPTAVNGICVYKHAFLYSANKYT